MHPIRVSLTALLCVTLALPSLCAPIPVQLCSISSLYVVPFQKECFLDSHYSSLVRQFSRRCMSCSCRRWCLPRPSHQLGQITVLSQLRRWHRSSRRFTCFTFKPVLLSTTNSYTPRQDTLCPQRSGRVISRGWPYCLALDQYFELDTRRSTSYARRGICDNIQYEVSSTRCSWCTIWQGYATKETILTFGVYLRRDTPVTCWAGGPFGLRRVLWQLLEPVSECQAPIIVRPSS